MFKLSNVQVWVHDQDEALDWYTTKLGFEVREDVTMPELGNFRWLSVGPSDDQTVGIVLMAIPGAPMFEQETIDQLHALMSKGVSGGLFFETDDVQKSYDELSARGVEFTQEPTEMPYGIDTGFRDPSGNQFRLAQRTPVSSS